MAGARPVAQRTASANSSPRFARLSPEEDALIIGGEDDDDIDETLPADLWFRMRQPRAPLAHDTAKRLSTGC